MFLDKTIDRNPKLIDSAVKLYRQGLIQADSYLVDVDTLLDNAKKILDTANQHDIRLYFMLKQLGRNPYIAKKLVELGYDGVVAVDFREALLMAENNIPLANVGHLVQTPKHLLKKLISYGVEVFTVYSIEKLREINEIAESLGMVQKIMIKVAGKDDLFYSGQYSGIEIDDLLEFIGQAKELKNIKLVGVTAFPCYLYNYESKDIEKTNNYYTLEKAVKIMEDQGLEISHINTPSTTSVVTLNKMKDDIGNIGEPGHGLTGTTPAHADHDLDEIPSIVYISEVSHNFRGKSYVYGGGHYRRSHVYKCLVVNGDQSHMNKILPMANDSIDYYFELASEEEISSIVLMAFRFQIFVCRSNLVLIEGIKEDNPRIVGTYSALGELIDE